MNKTSFLQKICADNAAKISHSLKKSGMGRQLIDYMKTNKLAGQDETVFGVFDRCSKFLANSGKKFYSEKELIEKQEKFLEKVCRFEVILGSPILTNAGRRDKSLSACSIPPVDLKTMSKEEIRSIVEQYHTRGMGTGFCLDTVEDPVEIVKILNANAIAEVQSGKIERSCGNMGVLNINHPKVVEFIRVKTDNPQIKEWKFNLSVNLTHQFIDAITNNHPFKLSDGTLVDPKYLMRQVAENAHGTGDPGIIFMDTINELNRVPQAGRYESVVPCGEVALFKGEVCQFAYLNLLRFVKNGQIDQEALKDAVHTIVEMLDNAVEANIEKMPNDRSQNIIRSLRRIGVGLCGFAETLQAIGFGYGSEEAMRFGANVMSLINFESKKASIFLAQQRGPFPLFLNDATKKELFLEPFKANPTEFVSTEDWQKLESLFSQYKIRNLSTTILPPSGRSSLMAGVTGSIEPAFRLVPDHNFQEAFERQMQKYNVSIPIDEVLNEVSVAGSVDGLDIPETIKTVFKTATELSPEIHLSKVALFQKHIDEGISKTVNLPNKASVENVIDTFLKAHKAGLKGVTIYRDGCRIFQPKVLTKKDEKKTMNLSIIDPIYGPFEVSPKIQALIASESFQRLKKIHQNGIAYLIDSRQNTSRFEHSIGVMLLTKILGGTENEQIAALLHDISHTAFSHLTDQLFKNEKQNHHELIREEFLNSEKLLKTLRALEINPKDVHLEDHPKVKGDGINTDRLDYMIRDLKAMNRIYQPQYSSIVHHLSFDKDEKVKCQNLSVAKLVFDKFLEVNQEIYFDPKVEANTLVMTTILQKMLDRGELDQEDFLTTDDEIIEKIKKGSFKSIFEKIGPDLEFSISTTPTQTSALRKLRFIDPEIVGLSGTLTDHCPESKKKLETYLQTATEVHYNIPILNEIL